VILIDGDMLVYRVGFACDEESEDVATQTLDNYLSEMVVDLSEHYTSSIVYLTGKGNFRDEVATTQPYKGNRDNKRVPVHKNLLRDYMVTEWNAQVVNGMEADDAIAIKATELDHDVIICSLDKDFKQIPCRMYDYTKKNLNAFNSDDAMRWLYKQALMGDRVDNIPGIYGIGPKKADKIIDPCITEWECYSTCLTHYWDNELDEDRLLESLQLLYLLRSPDDKYEKPSEI
jgi:5'-3' exonuclease